MFTNAKACAEWKQTSVVVRHGIRLLTIGLPNMLAGEVYAFVLDGSTVSCLFDGLARGLMSGPLIEPTL